MNLAELTLADRYLDRVTELPPAPTVAVELLGLFGDPNIDIDRVVDLIRQDPALTANVIRMCNSPYFRGAEPSKDIFEAITHLGFYQVYRVVSALLGSRAMSGWKAKGSLDINEIWKHSVASAIAAGRLARRAGESEAIAYTAGLLHDIGKLVFASVEGPRYVALVRKAETAGDSIGESERAEFGVDHAAIGAKLLARWGLPPDLTQAVGFHFDAPQDGAPFERLTAIIQIASDVAEQFKIESSQDKLTMMRHPEAMELLGITAEDIPTLIAETKRGLEQVAGLSNLSFDAAI